MSTLGALRAIRAGDRGAHLLKRERQVPREYEDAARKLDQLHHNLPPLREQKARGLQGPVLATLPGLPQVRGGLVVGSFAEASPNVHKLMAEVADARASREWRLLGAHSKDELRGQYTTQATQRWSCTFWREWARFMQTRTARVTSPDGELSTLAPRRARRGEFYVARLRPDSGPPGPRGLGL